MTNNPPIHLQKAIAIGSTQVPLEYSDRVNAVLELTPILSGPIFEPLHDPGYFAKMEIESDTLRWPNGADIHPDVLRLWAEKGQVLIQEETDAHFITNPSASQYVA